MDKIEKVARAIAAELGRQDYGKPLVLGDDLKLDYLDQGEVDFRLVAQAAATIYERRIAKLEEALDPFARVAAIADAAMPDAPDDLPCRDFGTCPLRTCTLFLAALGLCLSSSAGALGVNICSGFSHGAVLHAEPGSRNVVFPLLMHLRRPFGGNLNALRKLILVREPHTHDHAWAASLAEFGQRSGDQTIKYGLLGLEGDSVLEGHKEGFLLQDVALLPEKSRGLFEWCRPFKQAGIRLECHGISGTGRLVPNEYLKPSIIPVQMGYEIHVDDDGARFHSPLMLIFHKIKFIDRGSCLALRFGESDINKPNADATQHYADNGGRPHKEGPQRTRFLGYKILLLAFITTLFAMCLYRAISLCERGKTIAAQPYIVLGVAGIFGCLILGPPLIFGLS